MLFESEILTEAWHNLVFEAKNQNSRWWLKPANLRVPDIKFINETLCPESGLEIYSPKLKVIKELSVNLVHSWLTESIYLFVHKFNTVTGPCTQLTYINDQMFFTGIQDRLTFNLLSTEFKDYAAWGMKVMDKALEGVMSVNNYKLDHVWINPSVSDLESKGLLTPITQALFLMHSRLTPLNRALFLKHSDSEI